ncbi:tetraspanin-33b isoform X3 [Oryzias melastigma]|uniref:tetraspanin-33b isoform X3 n=1 Tax=Oryzias melastigma TaxID=30732 RepID=UPI000CF80B4D|nr:tetraspanin-33b isoform X3 [Oryzias melastigma]
MERELSLNRAETFSFVNPWIRYFLFFFSFLFWVFSLLIVAIGVYAKVQKATETVRDTFLVDPAVILIVVGVVMFFITFCGCIGALRENIRLLKTFSFSLTLVFLIHLAIAILGFFYSDQTRDALEKFARKAIVHYRDDLDLQNLMDYIQKEFKCCGWNGYTDWSWNLYFNCTGRDQHHVWLRGPDPKVSGCKQVDIPRGLRGQSRDVDRDPSAAGGGAHAGSGLASDRRHRAVADPHLSDPG